MRPEASAAASGNQEAVEVRNEHAEASASGRPPAAAPVKGVGRCFYTRLPRNAKVRYVASVFTLKSVSCRA